MAISALLGFSAANVRSFREEVNFSLVATRMADPTVVRELPWEASGRTYRVLPAAGVFGANASGKTTLLRAIADMRELVLQSFRHGTSGSGVRRAPFALDGQSADEPSRYEVELVLDGVRWHYGFELDDHAVRREWATHYPNGRPATVFERAEEITWGPPFRALAKTLGALVRDNALLLSVAGAASPTELQPLFAWFERNLLLAQSSNRPVRAARTADLVENEASRARVLAFLAAADLGVIGVARSKLPPEIKARIEKAMPILLGREADGETDDEFVIEDFIRLVHRGAHDDVALSPLDESLGTQVWFALAGPVLDALAGGNVLLADELDASLHPKLVEQLIRLFQAPDTNPRCAQLIFNAHDVTVLGDSDRRVLGRDQIWFTEKLDNGVTYLHALSEFSPRKDEALERRYLQGRFGALPIIDQGSLVDAVGLGV